MNDFELVLADPDTRGIVGFDALQYNSGNMNFAMCRAIAATLRSCRLRRLIAVHQVDLGSHTTRTLHHSEPIALMTVASA